MSVATSACAEVASVNRVPGEDCCSRPAPPPPHTQQPAQFLVEISYGGSWKLIYNGEEGTDSDYVGKGHDVCAQTLLNCSNHYNCCLRTFTTNHHTWLMLGYG